MPPSKPVPPRSSAKVQELIGVNKDTIRRHVWLRDLLLGLEHKMDEYPQLYWKIVFYCFQLDLPLPDGLQYSGLLYFLEEFGWFPTQHQPASEQAEQKVEQYYRVYLQTCYTCAPVDLQEFVDVVRFFPSDYVHVLQYGGFAQDTYSSYYQRRWCSTNSLEMTKLLIKKLQRYRAIAVQHSDGYRHIPLLTDQFVFQTRVTFALSVNALFMIAVKELKEQYEELKDQVVQDIREEMKYFDENEEARKFYVQTMFYFFMKNDTFIKYSDNLKLRLDKEGNCPGQRMMPGEFYQWLEHCTLYPKKWQYPSLSNEDYNKTRDQIEAERKNLTQVQVDEPNLRYAQYLRMIAILPRVDSHHKWTEDDLMCIFTDSMGENALKFNRNKPDSNLTKELLSERTRIRDIIIWLLVVVKRAKRELLNPKPVLEEVKPDLLEAKQTFHEAKQEVLDAHDILEVKIKQYEAMPTPEAEQELVDATDILKATRTCFPLEHLKAKPPLEEAKLELLKAKLMLEEAIPELILEEAKPDLMLEATRELEEANQRLGDKKKQFNEKGTPEAEQELKDVQRIYYVKLEQYNRAKREEKNEKTQPN